MSDRNSSHGTASGESLLFLTDDQLRRGIEAMFFSYKGFTADPDRICLLYTSPTPRDRQKSRMPSSA